MKLIHFAFIPVFCVIPLKAAVVAHWRFEDGGFYSDSSGNGRDLATSVTNPATQVVLSDTGNGSNFPTAVAGTGAASFDGGDRMAISYDSVFKSTTFTLEALVNRTSTNTSTKTIAGMWTGSGTSRIYLMAITGTNVLAYLFNGGTVSSGLPALGVNTDYYVGVSVDMTDETASGVTFYQKNLATGETWTSGVAHTGTVFSAGTTSFAIGSTTTPSSPWAGLIDEVRYSDTKLTGMDLLVPIPELGSASLVGFAALLAGLRRRR